MNGAGRLFRIKQCAAATATLVFAAWGACAADTAWNTAANGSWTNASNWNNGVPNANAALLTNASASYAVTYDGGAGNSITNVVIMNASAGNKTTLNVNSGALNITGTQSAGGVAVDSNALMNVMGASVNDASVLSVSAGGVIVISGGSSNLFTTYDDFESYTNNEVLATNFNAMVTGSPWGRFGFAVAGNPTAGTGEGVGGSMGADFDLDWTQPSANSASLVFWFSSLTNLVSTPGISIALAISNTSAVVSNTTVQIGFEEPDGTTYQTTAAFAQVLTNAAYQTFTFTMQPSTMELAQGSSPFDLSQVKDLRIRFGNAGATGAQRILIDNYQGIPGGSTWNQTAGNVAIGEVGNGTVVIGSGGLMTGPANTPVIGRNDTLLIPATAAASNAVGHLYIEGGAFLWPGRSGSANPLAIGRGQIGIVTVSNGFFAITSAQATNGMRIGYTSATAPSTGRGTVEMFGGVVTNMGPAQVGAGQGSGSTFGVGSITVSGGTFYQLGSAPAGAAATVRLPNSSFDSGYLTVNGSGTFLSTNALIVGNDAQANGSILVSGNGQLIVTNVSSNPGLILLGVSGTGTLSLSGGLTVADRLVATSGVRSVVSFAGGELDVTVQTVVSNSVVFTVGNGTLAATLDFVGGTHWFGNGLNISGNGVLTGVGTINAAVTLANNAVWAPGGTAGGTQTVVGATVLNPTTILDYEFGAPGGPADLVNIIGDLTLDGALNVTDLGGFTNGTYTLFAYTGSLVDNTLSVGTLPAGLSGTISNDTVGKLVLLSVSNTPSDLFTSWQTHYFPGGGPNAAGSADPDHDGVSNTNEFLTGFSPTNNAAYPHVTSITKSGTNIVVTYLGASGDNTWSPGVASRTNVLEFTTGTVNGSFATNNFTSTGQTNILSGGNGSGTVTSFVDTNGASSTPSRYYRVRVLAP